RQGRRAALRRQRPAGHRAPRPQRPPPRGAGRLDARGGPLMNKQDVLRTIAGATVDGVSAFLYEQAPGEVLGGEPTVVVGRDPLDGLAMPALTAFVSYEAGQGGFLFAIPLAAARRLIAEGDAPAGDADADADELSESEQAAFDAAMGRLIEAAATAMGGVLGQKVDVDAPAITAARTRAE